MNPGSAGAPIFQLEFVPTSGPLPGWESGDLAQIILPDDKDHPRDYSIANIPADNCLQLLVRRELRSDGSVGAASGWLSTELAPGATMSMRLRGHDNFRLGLNSARPLILIGNGTGIAGLRAHLKARVANATSRNWLIFGERNSRFDDLYGDELEAWHRSGILTRLDRVYSRDQEERRYVQHQLRGSAAEVRAWIADGAAIYVCGSLIGMAGEVETALNDILGTTEVEQLAASGRYRRDVY
jgi:sulfite reductase (NADPH) flavoprotein alpha-component